jgi:DNA-binding response OmpR family regulator
MLDSGDRRRRTDPTLAQAYLEAGGYTVHVAADGPAGLAAFRRYRPDLIVLDVMLPAWMGWSCSSSSGASPRCTSCS